MTAQDSTSESTSFGRRFTFLILSLTLFGARSCCCDGIPVFKVQGKHYDVGYKIGQQFRKELQNLYFNFEILFDELIPFYQTDEGYDIFTEYLEIVNETYPGYLDELYGISAGAFVPFDRIFLMHIRPEVELLLQQQRPQHPRNLTMTSSCSDVMLNYKDIATGQQYTLHAHNEDTDTINKGQAFILQVLITDDEGAVKENFTVLSYAGQVFGVFLGFNMHGLTFSANSLFPKSTQRNKTPILFMSRAAFAAKTVDEAMSVVLHDKYGAATGFSVNVGAMSRSKDNLTLMNIEVSPDATKGKTRWTNVTIPVMNNNKDGSYYHFNMYKNSAVAQYDDPSSEHRQARANQLPVPKDLTGILDILGDTKDKNYPLYRTGSEKDPIATVATGVFDLIKGTWSLYDDNPKTSQGPVLVFQLPTQ
ncbi:beta-alanyl-dopamine/carcinine hydrolase-like [Ptychodera flava]|uniref:beta-alanyl-dopamine/carcinine hydrolase-like n=1 Tax=Ptychodera flava TaxID=63121 RepID=UPI00396A47E8